MLFIKTGRGGLLLAWWLIFSQLAYANEQELIGTVEVVQIDLITQVAEFEYYLAVGDQRPVKLWFSAMAFTDRPTTGQSVRVYGQSINDGFEVSRWILQDQSNKDLFAPSHQGDAGHFDEAAQLQDANVLVLIVDLQDAKASSRYTQDSVAKLMYTDTRSVDSLLRASSYQQLGLNADANGDGSADVFGPFTIDYHAAQSCDYYNWAFAAEQAATDAGIDLSLYRHRVFVLPRYNDLPKCAWAGIANLGCANYCRAWVAEAESGMVFAHELGHNLAWHHAGTDPENDGIINSHYGDHSGIMGSNRSWSQANAPHRDQLGWFNAFPSSLQLIETSGTFDLYPLEMDPGFGSIGTQVIKFAKPDTNEFYYLSYRRSIGDFPTKATYADKISLHRYRGIGAVPTALIAVLNEGEEFNDPGQGLTVTPLLVGGEVASVHIGYDCARNAPHITAALAEVITRPGAVVGVTFTVRNNDDPGCAPTLFELSSQLPQGVEDALQAHTLSVLPGESKDIVWPVQVRSDTAHGDYELTFGVGDSVTQRVPQFNVVTLSVDALIPSEPSKLRASVSRDHKVMLAWGAAQDIGSGLRHYSVFKNGQHLLDSTMLRYYDSSTQAGEQHLYEIIAVDNAGNHSARMGIPVQVERVPRRRGGSR